MSISRQNLSIVIVTLKSENVIHQCIKSINKDIPIIVVENSSDSKFKEDIIKAANWIKNSLIKAHVHIKDGAKIGVKGFGFIPIKQKNLRTPQIGKVILEEGVEIGANTVVDRGSVADTTIGKNTFLDNQVHIAHNVKIGEDCMIAGQVGIAGSTIIGNNVMIGGQAGIAGHLKIGNNVKIGGGSGITTDLADNSKVMGYPAIPLRDFARLRNKNEK